MSAFRVVCDDYTIEVATRAEAERKLAALEAAGDCKLPHRIVEPTFRIGQTVLYRPPRKSRARRYTVNAVIGDRVRLGYTSKLARGGTPVSGWVDAPADEVRPT